MKTRIFYTKFWIDGYILSLNRAEKIAFIYLITNEQIGLTGIYELPDMKILFETGLTQIELEQIKKKFTKDKKMIFYQGWIKILNTEKYQMYKGEKNEKAKENETNLIDKGILDTLSIPYRKGMYSPYNHKSVISNQKEVVKGKKITNETITKIAKKYGISISYVKTANDEMQNWMKAKGKSYKDEEAGLRNWVIRSKKQEETKTTGDFSRLIKESGL